MRFTASAAGVAVLLGALCACGGGNDDSAGDKGAVVKAAQEENSRYASGDFAGAYDLWTDAAKKVMSRTDYEKYAKACAGTGVTAKITFARWSNDAKTRAIIRQSIGSFAASNELRLQDGAWRWQPGADAIAMYALGADGAIAAAKKDGSCD